jgi:polysaccharide export outer membrane protein
MEADALAGGNSQRRSGALAARALALAVLAASLGCSTTLASSPAPESSPAYRVGAPDQLRITVLPEPTIEAIVQVRPDGMISVPLIGEVAAAGRTIPEISSEIEERIARYKRGPVVDVALVAAASTDITVLGEVAGPSTFPLVRETRVLDAIGQVGGLTNFGWSSRIRVIRERDGKAEVLRVDFSEIRNGDMTSNVILEPGDFIYVPPTILARIGYFVQLLIFPVQPLLGVGQSIGGNAILP